MNQIQTSTSNFQFDCKSNHLIVSLDCKSKHSIVWIWLQSFDCLHLIAKAIIWKFGFDCKCLLFAIEQFPLKMLHPPNPPNRDNQIPQHLALQILMRFWSSMNLHRGIWVFRSADRNPPAGGFQGCSIFREISRLCGISHIAMATQSIHTYTHMYTYTYMPSTLSCISQKERHFFKLHSKNHVTYESVISDRDVKGVPCFWI